MQQGEQGTSNKITGINIPIEIKECIEHCLSCYQSCAQAIPYCLDKGYNHADPEHIKIMQDCANICASSADFMIRQSEFHFLTSATCAKICTMCAISCDALADDEVMKNCADICRKCAKCCREMAFNH